MHPNAPPLSKQQPNPMNEFNHSPPPTYNLDYVNENAISNKKSLIKASNDNDEDDLGLPTIPNSLPDGFEIKNNNNSNKNNNNNNNGSDSIDYDDLTARFHNLKSFK
jgi:hypothetical protein